MRLIIDTDAGVDDAQALMLALRHPGVQVEAITTVCGNVGVDQVIANVFTTLDVMNADVPVYRGASEPLVSDWSAEAWHGDDGLGNLRSRPPSKRQVEPEQAALALIRLANAHPGELTLVALAPMTNLALAIRLDPTFPSKIKEFIFMGGAHSAIGNTQNVTAEWNIYCDPEAAYITLKAFPQARMISWEATLEHPFTWEQYDELAAIAHTRRGVFQGDRIAHQQRRTPRPQSVSDPRPAGDGGRARTVDCTPQRAALCYRRTGRNPFARANDPRPQPALTAFA